MRHNFVDYHGTGIGENTAVIGVGRTVAIYTRTPGFFLAPAVRVAVGWVYYGQRETVTVRD
ncbi:MAG: hypothetical protein ACYSUY_16765 [Planctomycetota bacterium]